MWVVVRSDLAARLSVEGRQRSHGLNQRDRPHSPAPPSRIPPNAKERGERRRLARGLDDRGGHRGLEEDRGGGSGPGARRASPVSRPQVLLGIDL